jgi:hypothetical protein
MTDGFIVFSENENCCQGGGKCHTHLEEHSTDHT